MTTYLMSLILAGSILLDSTFNKRKKRKILIMPDHGTCKIYVQYIDLNLFLHKHSYHATPVFSRSLGSGPKDPEPEGHGQYRQYR
jgi:hypothetical protein